MKTFDGKVCVVTGAASGIGAAAATHFAEQGGLVVLADLADATELADRLGGLYVRTDVSQPGDVENLINRATDRHGRVDVLVNNAGVIVESELDDAEPVDFERHMSVNSTGVFLGIKYGARAMPNGSSIVNTASLAGRIGVSGYGAYAASKAAVISLTQVAAMELGPRGVRVNCICPTSVETPMLQTQESGEIEREISKVASPLGIVIAAEQAAQVIAFLASPASSAVTGQAINVDAGASAGYSTALLHAIAVSVQG